MEALLVKWEYLLFTLESTTHLKNYSLSWCSESNYWTFLKRSLTYEKYFSSTASMGKDSIHSVHPSDIFIHHTDSVLHHEQRKQSGSHFTYVKCRHMAKESNNFCTLDILEAMLSREQTITEDFTSSETPHPTVLRYSWHMHTGIKAKHKAQRKLGKERKCSLTKNSIYVTFHSTIWISIIAIGIRDLFCQNTLRLSYHKTTLYLFKGILYSTAQFSTKSQLIHKVSPFFIVQKQSQNLLAFGPISSQAFLYTKGVRIKKITSCTSVAIWRFRTLQQSEKTNTNIIILKTVISRFAQILYLATFRKSS